MGFFSRVIRALLSFFHPSPRRRRRRKHYPKDLRAAMRQINNIRKRHGVEPIPIDDRALRLARARLRDLHRYHYFAHINPKTKSSPDTLKGKFGFKPHEGVAENLFGGGRSNNMRQAVDAWMKSEGHRRNLLFPEYVGGAVAAYRGNVVFIGAIDCRECHQEW